MMHESLPALSLESWEETRLYWQLVCQIMGKTRLFLHPPLNHWWHVPLYVTPRGLSTGTIPLDDGSLDIECDVHEGFVVLRVSSGRSERVLLDSRPIAEFYAEYMNALRFLGIRVQINPKPFDCKSKIPFHEDYTHTTCDLDAVRRGWWVLSQVSNVFQVFRGEFIGKSSPVHLFWHSFDLAVTRFSGRVAPSIPNADRVTREAYSHEVISAGFWFGDDNIPEAAFYCYVYPLPIGIDKAQLSPPNAEWIENRGSTMALLRYSKFRESNNPQQSLLDFLHRTYEIGSQLANWGPSLVYEE